MDLEESYRALGVKAGASLQEVRRSYRQLLKFFHPDRHQASPGLLRKATEETKKINLAYERVCAALGAGRGAGPEKRGKASRERGSANSAGPAPAIAGQPFVIPACGIRLNWVAAGRFRMGSPDAEAGRSKDEGPQTEVTISRGFWLGKFVVTQEEWRAVVEEVSGLKVEPSFFRGKSLPVEQVSWEDCQRWLEELNALEEGRVPHGFRYRLPTEAEWEFSCRAGSASRFYFGDGGDAGGGEGALAEHAWYSGNSGGQTHPVGEKKANGWGFCDMHGNVWEWCGDRYGGPLPGGRVTDPKGPIGGLNRIFRGGSWGVAGVRCRSAYRVWNRPEYRDYTVGFRLALAPLV